MSQSPRITSDVEACAALLRKGGLVALPTETVYGLAADARNAHAVSRIFAVKGRPADHPLIVHIADVALLEEWVTHVPAYARLLATAYWPGPLTLILPKRDDVPAIVTGGQATVGIRVPNHPLALSLLRAFGGGLAAPSANRFGRVSPTTAQHVATDLTGHLDAATDVVLDGGASSIGVESTIVDCTGTLPRLLRTGAVTVEMIEATTGLDVLDADGRIRASGTLASHYAPAAAVTLVEADAATDVEARCSRLQGPVGLIADARVPTPMGVVRLHAPDSASAYARGLFEALRAADDRGVRTIVAVLPDAAGLGAAVRDRLQRAAHERS